MFLLISSASAQISKPSFINGSSQTLTVCENATSFSIDTLMAIADISVGDTEKWYVIDSAKHGVVTGLPPTYTYIATAVSTGGTIIPTGIIYTPIPGYAGTDTFTIEIGNGFDTSATTVYVTVDSSPTLSSTLTPFDICDSTNFIYTPTSTTIGASFSWTRPSVTGISNPPNGSATSNPFETLINTTNASIPVTYIFTVTSPDGCSSVADVVVKVHAKPQLVSQLVDTVCSGGPVNYFPASSTGSATTYTWSRSPVAGITPPGGADTGNITEVLVNSTDTSIPVIYQIALTDSGCTALEDISVLVNPQPTITTITTEPSSSPCAGTQFVNFGAGIAAPPGVTYEWEAINANIFAQGSGHQFALVNFPYTGTAMVVLIMSVEHCVVYDTATYTVDSSTFNTVGVLYYDNQFVYPDNTIQSYQWGYDDAVTYDSTMITGAEFQSYVDPSPDFVDYNYWVIVSKNGCSRKVYYNPPTGITNINANNLSVKVYPNPASADVTVTVSGGAGRGTTVLLTDMLGQTIKTQLVNGHTAQFNVSDMPAGCYLISCLQSGVKVSSTPFIKN